MAHIRIFSPRQARCIAPEPSLAELIDDPVTLAVMRRDGVTREALVKTLDIARRRIAQASMARCCA